MKKTLLTIISALFLNGCRTTGQPQEFVGEQCQPVFKYEENGELNTDESFCRCRDYTISMEFIGSYGKVFRKELNYCNQYLGYSIKDNNRLVDFYLYVQSQINAEDGQNVEAREAEE